ncbi:AmmeMemoRadiSam system protein A [Calditrichota bacterium GD2]
MGFNLNQDEKKYLLQLARETIKARLFGRPLPQPEAISENLKTNTGAFVTLTKNGRLRGCIGYVVGLKPLYQAIQELAIAAAFNDPRFPPLEKEELDDVEIEISVLTPLEPVKDVSEIETGKHGLMVRNGFYEGLLLPQVASEYGWDRETFLSETCLKAGLPPTAWQDPRTEIFKFSALIFRENDGKR